MNRKFLAILGLAVTLGFHANASVLIGWDFNGFDGNTFLYTGTDSGGLAYSGGGLNPGITGHVIVGGGTYGVGDNSAIANPPDVPEDSNPYGVGPIANTFSANSFDATSQSNAFENLKYFEFTLSSTSALDLNNILLQVNRAGADAPDQYAVYSDFGNAGTFTTLTGTGASGTLAIGPQTVSVLLGFAMPASTLTFRLYAWGSGDGASVLSFQNGSGDSIVVNGDVAVVPEPSTYALLLLGLTGMALIVRVKKRQPKLIPVKVKA